MYDKKFYTLLDYVFAEEGGFSNHKNDRGGRTYKRPGFQKL